MTPANNKPCDCCGVTRPKVIQFAINYDEYFHCVCLVCLERAAQMVCGEVEPTEGELEEARRVEM